MQRPYDGPSSRPGHTRRFRPHPENRCRDTGSAAHCPPGPEWKQTPHGSAYPRDGNCRPPGPGASPTGWNTEYPDMPNTDHLHPHRAGYMLWPAPKRPPKSGPKRPLSFLFPISCCDPSFPQRQALRPLIEWIHSTLSSPFFQTKWAKRKPDSRDIPRSPAKKTISSGCSVPQWPAARPGSRPAAPDTSPGCSFR